MQNSQRRNSFIAILSILILMGTVYALYIRIGNSSGRKLLVYKIYSEEDPPIINRILRRVPNDFSTYLKINVVETVGKFELLCVVRTNYSFPVYNLYLKTPEGELLNFQEGGLVGKNVQVYFNISAFNLYLNEKYKIKTRQIVNDELLNFLGNECLERSIYLIINKNDIENLLAKNAQRKTIRTIMNPNDPTIFQQKGGILGWHSSLGLIRVFIKLNPDYCVKSIGVVRIGYLGIETINL